MQDNPDGASGPVNISHHVRTTRVWTAGIGVALLMLVDTAGVPAQPVVRAQSVMSLLTLPERFTLTYRAVVTDVRPEDMRKSLLGDDRDVERELARDGRGTTAEGTKVRDDVADLLAVHPAVAFHATLSQSGARALLRIQAPDVPGSFSPGDTAYVYDGRSTLECQHGKGFAMRTPGVGRLLTLGLPIPGLSLASVPLIQDARLSTKPGRQLELLGASPAFDAPADRVYFDDAALELQPVGGGFRAVSCLVSMPPENIPMYRWVFRSYESFEGRWLAKSMVFTRYRSYLRNGSLACGPEAEVDFTLEKAVPKALPDSSFTFDNWVVKGDTVEDAAASLPVSRHPIAIQYGGPGAGSLDDQLRREFAREAAEERAEDDGRVRGHGYAGVFLLVSFAFLLLRLWHRRRVNP